MQIDYDLMYQSLSDTGMHEWSESLRPALQTYFDNINHGDFKEWQRALQTLPELTPSQVRLNQPVVHIGDKEDATELQKEVLRTQLGNLMPWRKGPFNLFGVHIDAEWRSDFKWDRLADKISPLNGRTVLDVGCGNGYYALRMLGEQARLVIGIDPTLRFVMQFQAFKQYLPDHPAFILPFTLEQTESAGMQFDTVFSMGVIYHRKDPFDHLNRLFQCLRSGGELVMESLIMDGTETDVLKPSGSYAKMNNVWQIPACPLLELWLKQSGFTNIRTIDVTTTTSEEQRVTEWMQFESLTDFLDARDQSKTIEGYPAPKRAILIAEKP